MGLRTLVHDVFISHCGIDKDFADAACAKLEQHGIRCFIVPRDVPRGVRWAQATADAIKACRIVVFVVSAPAMASESIEREIMLAGDHRKVILPIKIEDCILSESLRLKLAPVHWLDAMTDSRERTLRVLTETVVKLLEDRGPSPRITLASDLYEPSFAPGKQSNQPVPAYEPPPYTSRPTIDSLYDAGSLDDPVTSLPDSTVMKEQQRGFSNITLSPLVSVIAALLIVASVIMICVYFFMVFIDFNPETVSAMNMAQNETGAQKMLNAKIFYNQLKARLVPQSSSPLVQQQLMRQEAQLGGPAQVSSSYQRVPSSVMLTAFPSPSVVGSSVTLTASVSSSANTDGGVVKFCSQNGTQVLGTGTVSNGTAVCILNAGFPAPGTEALMAVYQGNRLSQDSVSAPLNEVVSPPL